jgi:hypothetical protein
VRGIRVITKTPRRPSIPFYVPVTLLMLLLSVFLIVGLSFVRRIEFPFGSRVFALRCRYDPTTYAEFSGSEEGDWSVERSLGPFNFSVWWQERGASFHSVFDD